MKTASFVLLFYLAVGVCGAAVVPHVGFVYPAGGLPGDTIQVTIGGQYLKDFADLHLSGVPAKSQLTDYLRVYDRQEINRIRRMKETFEAKLAEESDIQVKAQIERQIDLVEHELEMIKEITREDKANPAMAAKKQFNPQIAERITVDLTLPENTAPGDYELRVITTNGISNPLLFQIGQMPEHAEHEPNSRNYEAETLPALPVLVNGQIMPGDVDSFRFSARKGQTLVFRAAARLLVPYLADAVPGWFQAVLILYDAQGNELAHNDDFHFDPDPVLIYRVPADGDYVLSIRDSIFRGREDFVYRITIGETPFIESLFPLGGMPGREVSVRLSGVNLPVEQLKLKTGRDTPGLRPIRVEKDGLFSNVRNFSVAPFPDCMESEPNDAFSQAQKVTSGTMINGIIGTAGDQDWFCFDGRQGEKMTLEVSARRLGSSLDARQILFNAKQEVLASNDDAEDKGCGLITHHADSRIDLTLPESGRFFVRLDDLQGKGGGDCAYRLRIGETLPDFQLRIVPSCLNIPRNGTAIATVHAIRTSGFTGEIDLSLLNAPHGIELQRAVIPEGAATARIVVAANPGAKEEILPLEIEGSAVCGSQTLCRRAVPAEDMMQAFFYRHWVPAQQLLVRVCEPQPAEVVLTLPKDGVFQARPGSEIVIKAAVQWNAKQQKGIKLTLSEPPEWLTLKTGTLNGKGGTVVLTVSPNAEPGDTAAVLLTGTLRIAKTPEDADYNPVMKFLNNKAVDFTIDALSIRITN